LAKANASLQVKRNMQDQDSSDDASDKSANSDNALKQSIINDDDQREANKYPSIMPSLFGYRDPRMMYAVQGGIMPGAGVGISVKQTAAGLKTILEKTA
jgi:hypothetical protein